LLRLSKPLNRNQLISSNGELQITRGQPVDNQNKVGREFMLFQGTLHYYYTSESNCNAPTNAPTNTPSLAPSIMLSSIPTFIITTQPSIKHSDLPTIEPTTLQPSTFKPTSAHSLLPSTFPSNSPTFSPSSAPTQLQLGEHQLMTFVLYSYSVEHEPDTKSPQLVSLLESTISMYLQAYLEDTSSELHEIVLDSNLDLTSVTSSMKEGTYANTKCNPTSNNNVCTTLHANITTIHNKTISTGLVRYFLYKYGPILGKSLPFPSVNYTGIQPLLTYQLIKLNGQGLSPMQKDENTFYESTVKTFLDSNVDNSIAITGVTTDTAKLGLRRLQSSDNLDIDTGIFGEYNPPPYVDFDALVQESFDKHGDQLLNRLSERQYFKKVKNIKSYSSFAGKSAKQPQVQIKSTPNEPVVESKDGGALSFTAIVVYAICGPLLILSVIVICCVLQRYNKDDNTIEFEEDPAFLNKVSPFQSVGSGSTMSASKGSYNSRRSSFGDSARRKSFGIDECSYGVYSDRGRPYY